MSHIILFDGVCNVCDSSVKFIMKRDPKGHFKFASLQSNIAQRLLEKNNLDKNLNSIILIEANGRTYHSSTAALRIAKRLHGLWKLLYGLIILPPFIRNAVYQLIAKNRYKWFGKKEECMLPTKEQRDRFL